MMDFIVQFLSPFFAFLTAMLIAVTFWQMKASEQHEKSEDNRHKHISNSQTQIIKEVQKVHKKIDDEVLPSIFDAYTKRPKNYYQLDSQGLSEAMELIGYGNTVSNENKDMFLLGIEEDDDSEIFGGSFKACFFIYLDTEAKDITIESHSYGFSENRLDIAELILSINDKYKISGFSLVKQEEMYIAKGQYLIDAPYGEFSSKTLDFAISSLFEAQKELFNRIKSMNVNITFIEPAKLISLAE